MTLERVCKYIVITAGIAGALFLFPFLLNAVAPFVAAFFTATLCQGLVRFLKNKFNIRRGISAALIVTLLVIGVIGLFILAVFQAFSQAKNMISAIPDTINVFYSRISTLTNQYNGFRAHLSPEALPVVDSLMNGVQLQLNDISQKVASGVLDIAKNLALALPEIFIFGIMFILGTFFFIKDYGQITEFLKVVLPKGVTKILSTAKSVLMKAFSSYLKAQFLLMLIVSAITTVCLLIIGKEYAFLWGIVCGLVDALPLLGTAAVLVPWALISFIYGDMYSFVALLIIQVLVLVVRQLAEPKIISRQIGIHPILTLIGIYIGLKYFGLLGAILAPMLTLLGVNLYITYREER